VIEQLVQHLRDNAIVWLGAMFLGVFYWAFHKRKRNVHENKDRDGDL